MQLADLEEETHSTQDKDIRKLVAYTLSDVIGNSCSADHFINNPDRRLYGVDAPLTPGKFDEAIEYLGRELNIWKTDNSPEELTQEQKARLNSFTELVNYFIEKRSEEDHEDSYKRTMIGYGLATRKDFNKPTTLDDLFNSG